MPNPSPKAKVITGPTTPEPTPEPVAVEEPTPQFTVQINLSESDHRTHSGVSANFIIEASDAQVAASEAHRLTSDFAAAVPFVPTSVSVVVTPFRG